MLVTRMHPVYWLLCALALAALSPAPSYAQTPPPAATIVRRTAVRRAPTVDAPAAGQSARGDLVYVLSQAQDCAWLVVATSGGLVGWVAGGDVTLSVACNELPALTFAGEAVSESAPPMTRMPVTPALDPEADNASQPATGVLKRYIPASGSGEVEVKAGAYSALVVLVDTRTQRPAISIYVRANERALVDKIRIGTYIAYYTSGTGWDAGTQGFTRNAVYARFIEPLHFRSTAREYTRWTIELESGAGNEEHAASIAPDEFPQLE